MLWSVLFPAGECLAGDVAAPFEFDGRSLAGFTTWLRDTRSEDPRKVFTVSHGCLRISGDGFGYLATKRDGFENYRLTVEYRWGDQAGLDRRERRGKALDSGVFLHATGPDGNSHDGQGAYMAALECNLFEGATGDILLIRGDRADGTPLSPTATVEADRGRDSDGFPFWRPGGAVVSLERWGRINWRDKSRSWRDIRNFRGAEDAEKEPGKWNRVECVCRGDAISVSVNDRVVNRVTGVWPRRGRILLQCEGAEVLFRTFRVEPLRDVADSGSR